MDTKLAIVTLFVGIITASIAGYGAYQNYIGTEAIKSAVEQGNKDILNEINELNRKESAILEKAFDDFNPELKYRIFSIGFEQHIPNAIRVDITNNQDVHTFVKNKWTITGDICNEQNQHQGINYEFSNRTFFDLTKGEKKHLDIQIPDEFFTRIKPDKNGFLLKLELEMNPYTPSSGAVDTIEIPKKTFIQYDLNKERGGWMPWTNPGSDPNCTKDPSIWGHTFLNTSSIEDFLNVF